MFDKIRSVFDLRVTAPSPAQPPAGAAQSIPLRRLWWAAIVLLGLSASAVTWTIFQLRDDAIRAAISESGSIATVLAGQLSRSLQSIDSVLLEVKHSAEKGNFGASAEFPAEFDDSKFQEYLVEQLGQVRQIFGMALADKNGLIVVSTLSGATHRINISDRDYFRSARDRRDGELSISIPSANRVNGEKTIVFARRLDGPKGEFAGVVFAAVSTKYFEDIYDAIQSVHSLLFTLLNPDGIILFRHPDDGDSTGRELSNRAQWLEALSKDDQVFRLFGKADANVRYVSIRRVPEFPLIVDISLTESTVLDIWARRTGTIIVGSSVFLIFSLYLLAAMTRQVRSLSDSKASLAQKSQQLDAALNNMSQGLTMFDDRQRLIVSNTQFARIYGFTAEQTKPGVSLRSLLDSRKAIGSVPRDGEQFFTQTFEQVSNTEASDSVYTLLDGRTVSVAVQPMPNGGFVSIHQDITAQKRIEAELERRARYDALTGLANRTLLMEKIGEALARLGRQGEEFSILMLDLDRFKTVNDSFGHPAGDLLLKEVGRRLQNTTRDVDCVARLGGDEFAVLQVSDGNQVGGVIALCDRILKAITEPYDLEGRKLILETSIGIALAPQDGTDADVLIKNADLALYKAKAEGRNRYCFFEAGMEAKARERRELEDDMRKALERNEFELYYQTIVDLELREYCGAEALLRWHHPERGLIPPDQFIPLAEESGLIVPLGQWILRQACSEAAKWPSHLKIAANISPSQIKHGDLLDILKSALAETGLPPQRLQLEITETVLLERKPEHLAVLHEIKKLGVSIVLDDFGVGYSSMTYLQMFPFDRIKIDQSFIRSMTDHAAGAAIVCAIAGLGRTLDIATTAEGVETVEQLVFLRAAGCQFAQGYLFSRPVPASKLTFELPDALRRNLKAA
jgi:diguanylate cyclase (GGDEF)-like protein